MPPFTVYAVLAAVIAALGVALVLLNRLAVGVLRPPRRPHRRDPADLAAAPGVRVDEVALDGEVPLSGWWVRPAAGGRAARVVLVHGWGANAAVLLDVARALVAAGHTLFLIDVRAHGRSGDAPWVTLGQFVEDTHRAVAHVRAREPGGPLAVCGHSMGGAAAVVAAADDPDLAGLVLLAAPHDMYGTLIRYLHEQGMPGAAMVRLLRPFWTPRLGRPAAELDPGLRAPEVRRPTLVVQPERDHRVPREEGEALARDTAGTLLVVEGAGHNDVLERADVHAAATAFLADL
jgi:pimeloyl-ACP methyl ester carboxylesterase